jgi:hypothetical protein
VSPSIFPLRLAHPWRWPLRVIGVRDDAAQVELTDDARLVARFGPLSLETRLDNVCGYVLTGPYHWWKAIGPRGSQADRGFTFGTSTHGGVCLCFREWVPTRYVRGRRMEALTVTVDDVDGLAAALEERGIRGRDERRRSGAS